MQATSRENLANLLLAQLPEPARKKLTDGLAPVELRLHDVLCEPGDRIRNIFFPSTAVFR